MDRNIYKVGNITSTIDTVVTNINFILDTQKSTTIRKGTYYTKNINLLNSILKLLDYEYIHDFIYSNNTFYEKLQKLSDFITVKKDHLDLNDVNTYETLHEYEQFFEINLKSFIITNTIGKNLSCSDLETFIENLLDLQKRERKIDKLEAESKKLIKEYEEKIDNFFKISSDVVNRYAAIQSINAKIEKQESEFKQKLEFYNSTEFKDLKQQYTEKKEAFERIIKGIDDDLKHLQKKARNIETNTTREELAYYFLSEANEARIKFLGSVTTNG